MKKFLAGSVGLGLLLIASWIDFVPVHCAMCGRPVFRTDITSLVFGGHGVVIHEGCADVYASVELRELLVAPPTPLPPPARDLPLPVRLAPAS